MKAALSLVSRRAIYAISLVIIPGWFCGCGQTTGDAPGSARYTLQSKTNVSLGTFESTGARLVVGDPGYDLETIKSPGLGAVLTNCQTGTWRAEVIIKYFNPPGFPLTSELRVLHSTVSDADSLKWERQHDVIGTNTAQAGVYDLAHFHDHSLVPHDTKWTVSKGGPADPKDLWYSYCCELSLGKPEGGVLPFGVVATSGKGDGGYECSIAHDQAGTIIGIWIIFVDDSGKG